MSFRSLLGLTIAFALLVGGCGAWSVETAQRALQYGALAEEDFDNELATVIVRETDRCDTENESREDFVACMEPYQELRSGVRISRAGLRAGQAVVDAWRAGESNGEADWIPIAACIAHGLGQVATIVRQFDLDVLVSDVLAWIDTFGNIAAGVCPTDMLRELSRE